MVQTALPTLSRSAQVFPGPTPNPYPTPRALDTWPPRLSPVLTAFFDLRPPGNQGNQGGHLQLGRVKPTQATNASQCRAGYPLPRHGSATDIGITLCLGAIMALRNWSQQEIN